MIVYKKLVSNVISLSTIQIFNYVLPFVMIPYLVRVLGPQQYGLITFSQAVIQYFVLLTGYGFNLTATSAIAQNKNDHHKLSIIVSGVWAAKCMLMLVSALIVACLVFSVDFFRIHWILYVFSFGYVIADVAFPLWLFQGLEDMKFITLGNVVSKSISTLFIFVFVRNPSEFWVVPLILSSSSIIGGIVSCTIVVRKYRIQINRVPIRIMWNQLRDGWIVFLSTITISLYTTSNPVILGLLTNPGMVGYYTAAEKIINASQGILTVVSQSIFPHVSQLMGVSFEKGLKFIHRTLVLFTPGPLLVSLLLLFFAHPIVLILLGSKFALSVPILRILSFLPLLVWLSNIFGIQTMLSMNLKRPFIRILAVGALLNIGLSFLLVPELYQLGTAFSVLVSESMITLLMFVTLQSRGINMFTGKMTSSESYSFHV